MTRVCVFAGSSPGRRAAYEVAARNLGHMLARRGLALVYGGARVGLMGTLADAVLAEGGHVTGVIPSALVEKEVAHTGLSDLRVVPSMHERKAVMADLADAFVALPGGLGTLEETFEALTWAQLGLHQKALGLLNVEGYFDGLLAFLDHASVEGFLGPDYHWPIVVSGDPGALLDGLVTSRLPRQRNWIDRASS